MNDAKQQPEDTVTSPEATEATTAAAPQQPPAPPQQPPSQQPPAQAAGAGMPAPGPQPPGGNAAPGYPPAGQYPLEYYAAPRTPMSPAEERNLGMAAHLIPLVASILSAGFLGFVGALVMYLVYRDRGPFVRAASASSLNIQITAGIVMLISLPLMFVLIGFLTFFVAWVVALVLHVIGALKANEGTWWKPPVTLELVN